MGGKLIDDTLDIMEAIEENKPLEQILEIFKKQEHSGYSKSLIRSNVIMFSKKGYNFFKATHDGKWTKENEEFIQYVINREQSTITLPFDALPKSFVKQKSLKQ